MAREIEIGKPDDMHLHLRQGGQTLDWQVI